MTYGMTNATIKFTLTKIEGSYHMTKTVKLYQNYKLPVARPIDTSSYNLYLILSKELFNYNLKYIINKKRK